MGAVAKATHLVRRAPVALKFMSPAIMALYGAVERFVNEGVAASQIDSDHVVKVFDVGRLPNGAPYLVMEFLEGFDLGQLLEQSGGRVELRRAVHFALQILRALQTAHAAGIVHRDMKPSNCFIIEKDGEPDFVKIVDFGISKVTSDDAPAPNLTRTNSALGTPLYMSPEQARSPRDVDHRADLYSVGAILYQMLSGQTPYTADSGEYTEILFKIFTTEPTPIAALCPDVPPGFADVIHRALSRDLNTRYGSALEMAEALAPYADERSTVVLQRLRSGRGKSVLPPGPRPGTASIIPPTPVHSPAASANTALSSDAGTLPRPPKVPTEVGVTREARPPTMAGGRLPLALGGGAMLLVLGASSLILLRRAPPTATHEPSPAVAAPSAVTLAEPPSPPPPAAAMPPTSASSGPAVGASASSTASASAGATTAAKPPSSDSSPAAVKPPPGKQPSTLGGIQLH
jgi:serine/threonine-protein kinase